MLESNLLITPPIFDHPQAIQDPKTGFIHPLIHTYPWKSTKKYISFQHQQVFFYDCWGQQSSVSPLVLQYVLLIPEQSSFYDIKSRYFDRAKLTFKVLLSSISLLILIKINQIFQRVFDPAGLRAAKLWALKVCPGRESNPGRSESSDSLYKLAKNVASNPKGLVFFLTANFDGHNFATVWAKEGSNHGDSVYMVRLNCETILNFPLREYFK